MNLFTYLCSKIIVMKRFYTLYILLAVAVSVFSQNLKMVSPKYEVRAVWLTTIGGLD